MFSPLHVTVAEAPKRIGKQLFWCPVGSADGVWRGEDVPGMWRDPDSLGLGRSASIPKAYDYYCLDGETSVDFRAKLRRDLTGTSHRALIMGELAESVALAEHRNAWKTELPLPRNRKILNDAPRAWLTLDCDDLDLRLYDPDIDVVAQADELPNILSDIFDRCGLDWLIADAVVHYSSRFGLLDRHTFKAHLEWHLEKPLTLAEQKRVAMFANAKSAAAGYGEIFDLSIYTPEHLVFTAPALLQKRIWKPGEGIVAVPAQGPSIERVRLVTRGQPSIEIPSAATQPTAAEKIVKLTATIGKQKVSFGKALAGDVKLQPGNVYNSVRAHVYAAALNTPEHRTEAKLAELGEYLTQQIIALPDNDTEKLQRRLRYVSDLELRRSWETAIAKRRPWHATPVSLSRAHHSPLAARAIIQKASTAFVNESLSRLEGTAPVDEDNLITDKPKPIHLLMRVPPGIGKTHAALASIQPTHLTTQRISYLSPTVRLSEEAAARKLKSVDGEYLQSRIRHHKGRKQLCKSEEYGKLAERLEELGRSPVKDVCGRCPIRDACAWPVQHSDKESGLVAGQHAHATSSLAKLHEDSDNLPSFGIVDESLLSTMLADTQPSRSLAALRRASIKTTIRNDKNVVINSSTSDLHAYRDELLTALSRSKGRLSIASILYFAGQITITRRDGQKVTRTRIEDAMDMEFQAMRSYDAAMRAGLNAYHDLRASQLPTIGAERRMSSASAQLKLCGWFVDAYRAIQASQDAKRSYVFGLSLTATRVTIHLRAPLPAVFRARSWIWLDGTASEPIWSALFHNTPAELRVLDIPVEPGAYHLTQYPDKPYGRAMFEGSGPGSALRRLHRFIAYTAAKHAPRTVLVVTQKTVRNQLSLLPLPANVALEHFNAIRGLDAYKTAAAAIVVGRPLPSPSALEQLTEALHYDNADVQDIRRLSKWSPSARRELRIEGNATRPGNHARIPPQRIPDRLAEIGLSIPCEQHPDPRVEQLRQQVVDAEVRQAINRLRLYDRTADNPAELHVFGQVDTGLVVSRVADWQDAERESLEVIAVSGFLSTNQSIASRLVGGHCEGYSKDWFEKVVSNRRISVIALIESKKSAPRQENSLKGAITEIRLASATSAWKPYSVKVAELPYAAKVLVDTARHGTDPAEIREALIRETKLQVLSLWDGNEPASHRRGKGGSLIGHGHRGSSVSLSRSVAPVSVRSVKGSEP